MKNSEHYSNIKKWFDNATENDIRGINSEYGYMLYACYVLEKLDAPQNATILEIGCGDGVIMNKMISLRPDINFYGIDISAEMIKQSRMNNIDCNFHVGNIMDGIPYNIKFDRIFSFSVGQYLLEKDIIRLCLLCLNYISSDGLMYHFSIPDVKKRLPKLIDTSLEKYPLFLALLTGIFMHLINTKNKYYKDGSYWHSPKNIRAKLLQHHQCNNLNIQIEKSTIYWFRFDLSITICDNS